MTNDLEKFSKQIHQITEPIRQVSEIMNKVIPPYIQHLNEILSPIANRIIEIIKVHEPFFTQVRTTLLKIAEAAHKWQLEKKEDVALMAENGWYPNEFTFFYAPEISPKSVDEFMIMQLNDNWDEITSKMLKLCPDRAHILENAFKLHKSGNYIASIPLFISQADGICCESLIGSFLFTNNTVEANINKLIDEGEIDADMFTDIFLEPFKLKNHHNAGVSKASKPAKARAPSRNGILHGHRKHLDYGSETNSLKCFSLLSFIVYSTKDALIN